MVKWKKTRSRYLYFHKTRRRNESTFTTTFPYISSLKVPGMKVNFKMVDGLWLILIIMKENSKITNQTDKENGIWIMEMLSLVCMSKKFYQNLKNLTLKIKLQMLKNLDNTGLPIKRLHLKNERDNFHFHIIFIKQI